MVRKTHGIDEVWRKDCNRMVMEHVHLSLENKQCQLIGMHCSFIVREQQGYKFLNYCGEGIQ